MRWIIGAGKDVAVNYDQLQARRTYIQRVTGQEVSIWSCLYVNGQKWKDYLCCESNDNINGTFITAHIDDVRRICSLSGICNGEFVVANACIWRKMLDKELLSDMMYFNRKIELWFAKQELWVDNSKIMRQSATLYNIGRFGFHTSLSERELFRNRNKGFREAMRVSFIPVSLITQ